MADEWLTDDLPILQVIRALEAGADPGDQFQVAEIAEQSQVDPRRALKLLIRLARAEYIDGEPLETMEGILDFYVDGLTEKGRRAVGQWPSQDPWTGLVELLSQQIDEESDDERRGKLMKLRDGVLTAGRGIGVALLTKFLEQQAGLG